MYLVDTNVWLERLLNQAKSDEVGKFLSVVSSRELYVTDFAFHSICVILTRLARTKVLLDFVQDVFVDGEVNLLSIKPSDAHLLVEAIDTHKFDFDDAYQYVAVKQNELTLISFDTDFDRIANIRKTPSDISREISKLEQADKSD
jgi:predicted nucleic acid-binding protein